MPSQVAASKPAALAVVDYGKKIFEIDNVRFRAFFSSAA